MQNFYLNSKRRYRKIFSVIALLLILSLNTSAQTFTVDTILKNGARTNRINFAYISEGYTNGQLNTFITNTNTINDALFAQTPFQEYKSFFNAFAIRVPSTESGAIHPGTASDEASSGGQPVANPNIYFQSTFDYFSIHRLLVPQNDAGLNSVLAANLPDYDQGFVVVNSPYYGGSGGGYATASTDASSAEVAIHEIGHSFAGLADEYWAGIFYAAEKPNMTQDNNTSTVKWKSWLNIDGVGIYPYGSTSPENTWYRPHQTCKMQYLGYPFCAVCTERFVDRMHELVNMIDSYTPTSTSFALNNTNDVAFSVDNLQNLPATITVKWYLNRGTNPAPFATNVSAVSIPYSSFITGTNVVTAEAVDSVGLSKTYLPTAGYINKIDWTVTTSALPVVLKNFRGKVDGKNRGILDWEVATPEEVKSFDLQKSKDGTSFTKLAAIDGEKNRRLYNYTDGNLLTPYTFYRLAMKDKDGKINYSNTIRLSNAFDNFFYKVYQDGAAKNYHLTCAVRNESKIVMSITTANGTRIMTKDFGKINTQLDYDFNLQNQPAGIYFANIYFNNTLHTIKLVAN